MKRLKIRGKEIKRLGYTNDRAISLAINITSKNFRRSQKVEVLEILEKIAIHPLDYKDDSIFGPLASALLDKPTKKKEYSPVKIDLNKELSYKVYGKRDIDEQTILQMDMAMKLPISVKGALMADAHHGYGLPIGGVLATYNSVIPYAVGMDIGCRMCMSVYKTPDDYIDKKRNVLKNILLENTRFGRAEFNDIREHEIMERKEFSEIKFLKGLKDKAFAQLGTSGGGNHFVDVGYVEFKSGLNEYKIPKGKYLAVLSHSGSRGIGADIAGYYSRIAGEKRSMPKGVAKLAWLNLNEDEGIEYWKAMTLAGDYSSANHKIIHGKISKAINLEPVIQIENHHNFAWEEKINESETMIIHRKGATPAEEGILGIIPGSMLSPGFVVRGKGNSESLNSASHGAGRVLSRTKAKSIISRKLMEQQLKKAGVDLIGGGTDEAPGAYKDIYKVMEYQEKLVEIVGIFYPKIVRMC